MTGFPHLDQAALDDATNVLLVASEVGQSVSHSSLNCWYRSNHHPITSSA